MATEDFFAAARRLFRGAQNLDGLVEPARHTANHLYGLSAECALKATMQRLSGRRDSQMPRERRVHLPRIWFEYQRFLSGALSANYILDSPMALLNEWDINQRYLDDTYLTEAVHAKQVYEAKRIVRLLDELRLDGLEMELKA